MLKLMEKLSRCGRLEADVTAAELIKETNDGRITFFHGNIGGLVKKRQFGKSAERRPLKLGFSLAQRPSRIGQSPANLAVPSGPNDFRSGVDGIIGRGEDGNFAYQFFYTADEYEGAEGRMARFGRMRAHPRSHNGRRLPSNGPSIGPRLLGGVGGGGGLGPSLSLSPSLSRRVCEIAREGVSRLSSAEGPRLAIGWTRGRVEATAPSAAAAIMDFSMAGESLFDSPHLLPPLALLSNPCRPYYRAPLSLSPCPAPCPCPMPRQPPAGTRTASKPGSQFTREIRLALGK
jgi:hypothetical protein